MEIDTHKDNFGRIFELPFEGTFYTSEGPLGFKNMKSPKNLKYLVINPTEKIKFPFKQIHLKQKVRIIHYL